MVSYKWTVLDILVRLARQKETGPTRRASICSTSSTRGRRRNQARYLLYRTRDADATSYNKGLSTTCTDKTRLETGEAAMAATN